MWFGNSLHPREMTKNFNIEWKLFLIGMVICVCVCVCIYIYIYRERERERG